MTNTNTNVGGKMKRTTGRKLETALCAQQNAVNSTRNLTARWHEIEEHPYYVVRSYETVIAVYDPSMSVLYLNTHRYSRTTDTHQRLVTETLGCKKPGKRCYVWCESNNDLFCYALQAVNR